jgi:hypothetical protein
MSTNERPTPSFFEPGGIRRVLDRMEMEQRKREEQRLYPAERPKVPVREVVPLIVVGILMPGTFAELHERLTGILPFECRRGDTAIRFICTRDPKYAGRRWVTDLIRMGFALADNAPVLRGIAPALVDDDLIEERGVRDEDLPCIAFFVANAGAKPFVLRLPPIAPEAWRLLRTVFKEELSSERILGLRRQLPVDAPASVVSGAFAEHLDRVRRRLDPKSSVVDPVARGGQRKAETIAPAYLPKLPPGFERLQQVCKEFGIPRSSAQGLANKLPDESLKKVKNRLFVNVVEFRKVLKADGRNIHDRAKRRSPG